jgi:hypothetical protein
MWVNSEFVNKKQILQKGKKRKEVDKFEEKLMFTVNFNLTLLGVTLYFYLNFKSKLIYIV